MLYVFYHNLRACGAVHVVNLLKLNHTESFILFSLQKLKNPGLRIPYYKLECSAPRTVPSTCKMHVVDMCSYEGVCHTHMQ